MFYFNPVNCFLYSKVNGVSKKSEARKHHLNIICVSQITVIPCTHSFTQKKYMLLQMLIGFRLILKISYRRGSILSFIQATNFSTLKMTLLEDHI